MKTAVVTGGNRGIGEAVVRELVHKDFRVIFVARDTERGKALEQSIPNATFIAGDLGTVASTRAVAKSVLAAADSTIDVLIHNAGIWPSRTERNEDGVERAFAVNHLAPFLLNHLLRGAVARSETKRIVQVSAGLYIKGKVEAATLDETARGDRFHSIRTYADTKLCNLVVQARMARELGAITLNAVHPGVIRTGLGDRKDLLGLVVKAVKLLWKTPEEGARPIIRLATDPSLNGVTNRYYHLNEEMPVAAVAKDEDLAAAVWDHAVKITKIETHDHGSTRTSESARA